MNAELSWYRIPEVWLICVLLVGIEIGSFALVATAYRHTDTLRVAPHPIASPLPPSAAARPAED